MPTKHMMNFIPWRSSVHHTILFQIIMSPIKEEGGMLFSVWIPFALARLYLMTQEITRAQWLSGRVLDLTPRGCGLAALGCVLEQDTLIPA